MNYVLQDKNDHFPGFAISMSEVVACSLPRSRF